MNINIQINFGQCPYQLLNDVHPGKNKFVNNSDNNSILSKSSSEYNLCEGSNSSRITSANTNKTNKVNQNNIPTTKRIEDIYKIKGSGDILYFGKSLNNNYLYCLLNNRIFEIYKFDNKKNAFILVKQIIPKCQFLFLKKSKNKNLIFRPKYIFCEFNENAFICCRTLDKTLIYYNYIEEFEASFVLKAYTTCIINISNTNEFITGHDNGRICKWKINYSQKEKRVELEFLQLIKSNNKTITCLQYDEKLNVIISTDINTIMIRKSYDFEYFNSIDIQNEEKIKKFIVDVKISDYNFLYALIHLEDQDIYELQGYTINGTYFGKYCGKISNFEITKSGKIIIGEINKPYIKILEPTTFKEIYSKLISLKGENIFYHFYFECPNMIYYGVMNNDCTKIKMIFLDSDEEKYFT